jgi:hypothetical protein
LFLKRSHANFAWAGLKLEILLSPPSE